MKMLLSNFKDNNSNRLKLKHIAYSHLSYEIEMFVLSYEKLKNGNLNQYENNATLEVLLIHARCLLDFLYPPESKHKDDVIIDNFFDNNDFKKIMPKSLNISNYLRRRTGKEIVHLTYNRLEIDPEQKKWNFQEIHDQIISVLNIFFNLLPKERRDWFRIKVESKNILNKTISL